MEPIEIREARPGDGAACADLWVEFGRALAARMPGFREPVRDGLAEWFDDEIDQTGPGVLRALAFIGDVPVGLAHAVLRLPAAHPGSALREDMTVMRAILEDIVVAEAFRDQGIGSALLHHVRDWARGLGARSMMLHSDIDGPARRFYERHGFTIVNAGYISEL